MIDIVKLAVSTPGTICETMELIVSFQLTKIG